jgi:hypothetical protein
LPAGHTAPYNPGKQRRAAMSEVAFCLTVLVLAVVSIYLMREIHGRTTLRGKVPGHNDMALCVITNTAISVSVIVLALAVVCLLATFTLPTNHEKSRSLTIVFALTATVLPLLGRLFGWFTAPEPEEHWGRAYGPGWLILGKTWIYLEPGKSANIDGNMFFYGAVRTKREKALPLKPLALAPEKGGAVASTVTSFIPDSSFDNFWAIPPESYDVIVDQTYKAFIEALLELENPTEERVCNLVNSFRFDPRAIARVKSIKLGAEIFNIPPKG